MYVFVFSSDTLMTSDGGSLRLDDALKSIIILEKKIDLSVSTRPQFEIIEL